MISHHNNQLPTIGFNASIVPTTAKLCKELNMCMQSVLTTYQNASHELTQSLDVALALQLREKVLNIFSQGEAELRSKILAGEAKASVKEPAEGKVQGSKDSWMAKEAGKKSLNANEADTFMAVDGEAVSLGTWTGQHGFTPKVSQYSTLQGSIQLTEASSEIRYYDTTSLNTSKNASSKSSALIIKNTLSPNSTPSSKRRKRLKYRS